MLNYVSRVTLILIAALMTILVSLIVPENQFRPYRLDLDSTWTKEPDQHDYMVDLNNDGTNEIIRHNHINKPGHSLELIHNHRVSVIGIFGEKAFIVSRSLKFADINQDGIREVIFVAVDSRKASLFIMEFDFKPGKNPPVKNIQAIGIDSVNYQNNIPDVVNYEIVADNSELYFDLQAGYYVQPRNIYKYHYGSEKLIKTSRNSIVNKQLELLRFGGRIYLLARKVVVTANTWSPEQAAVFKNARNADSAKIYDQIKGNIYDFGDFSSYILLYHSNLEFAFPPVEFSGWTNYTLSEVLWKDSVPHIISLTKNQINDSLARKITLCNLYGKIVQQIPAEENFENLFADGDKFVLGFGNKLNVYSSGLKMERQFEGFSFAAGFYDLTANAGKEFIGFEKNDLVVFSEDFAKKTSFKIAQEFAPYPENQNPEILNNHGKSCLLFNSRLFYYLFSYEKNPFAWLKFPFYSAIFLFWSAVLMLLLRLNSKRHEKEKRHLENIVSDRTLELQMKNIELASQKEEIQAQSEKISEQYMHLEKLDHFKETLTHALVHDLKNPLSQIMVQTSDDAVHYPARKMLRLINNMLDVEKYEATGFNLNIEVHSLRGILGEVKTGQEPALRERNLKLNLHFSDLPVAVDQEVMVRVFDNLLSNAIRFSPRNQSIDIFAETAGDHFVRVGVKNVGDPIPEDFLPHVFDKYRQGGKSDSSAYRTTGLGLTICKMAIEAHGGTIGVISNQEDGTIFQFTIPCGSTPCVKNQDQNMLYDDPDTIPLSSTDVAALKEVVKQISTFEIYEISGFHSVLDPLKGACSSAIDAWISRLFSAIYSQNTDAFKGLINFAEHEQA